MARNLKPATAKADVGCAVCGRPLALWDSTTALDGRTVCAPGTGCLGGELARLQALEAEGCPRCGESPAECLCHLSAVHDGDL